MSASTLYLYGLVRAGVDTSGLAGIEDASAVFLIEERGLGCAATAVPAHEYDRLGIDEPTYELHGLKVPLIRMPVAPGRSLAILVEVAARNQLLRARGLNAARDLVNRLDRQLRQHGETDSEDVDHGEDV